LTKIYNATLQAHGTTAEKRTRNFLIRACVSWRTSNYGLRQEHRSTRQRKLERLSKALYKLAKKFEDPESMRQLIPPGPERREFLKSNIFNPRTIFEIESEMDEFATEDPYIRPDYIGVGDKFHFANQTPLRGLIRSFGYALDKQAKWLSDLPERRFTRLKVYMSLMRNLCKDSFGKVNHTVIIDIARVVTGEAISPDRVRTRTSKKARVQ